MRREHQAPFFVGSSTSVSLLFNSQSNSDFVPSWWCRDPHFQTLWPYLSNLGPGPEFRRERLELDDGDFLDIDWSEPTPAAPIVVILHGLGGSSQSHYVRRLVTCNLQAGFRSAVLHHRGCSGEPNRLVRGYHAGDAGDIYKVLRWLRQREPDTVLFAAGYSLGANMLLHHLHQNDPIVLAASSVSAPLELAAAADRMERGVSRIYQRHLVAGMKALLHQKSKRVQLPIDPGQLARVRTFRELDTLVTAPLHGFLNAEDYYSRCSVRNLLADIRTPTLLIHAADDPLTMPASIPQPGDISSAVEFKLSRHGGHCGFVSGAQPFRPCYWAEPQITRFFTSLLP